jgi:hypothetical protein
VGATLRPPVEFWCEAAASAAFSRNPGAQKARSGAVRAFLGGIFTEIANEKNFFLFCRFCGQDASLMRDNASRLGYKRLPSR